MGVLRYRYRLINSSEHCLFILSFIAQFKVLLLFILQKYFYLLVCCLIRAVLHPVLSAASDPGLELYKINFNFQSKIVFK